MKRLFVLLACLVAACGDDGGGGTGDPALDVSDGSGTAVETLTLAQTQVGQGSSGTVVVTNHGTAATGPLALSITGDAANDFTLDNELTTCAAHTLAAGESCDIAIGFRPTAAGDRTAELAIASNPGGTVHVALIGHAIMPSLHFNPPSLAFGQLEIGQTTQTTIELVNDGTVDAPLDSIVLNGAALSQGATTCGATLAAGASCDIVVNAAPQALGLLSGDITVTSSSVDYSAAITVRGARRISVVTDGTGAGTVTSSPAGISCGTTCSALFETATTLTVAPNASSQITSWSIPSCGSAATCTVPADITAATVTVSLTLTGTSSVNITYAGTGSGEVRLIKDGNDVLATCFASCSVPAMPGDSIEVVASTPSTFGGISGACSATSGSCTFTAPAGASAVTVTFDKDGKEQWTRLLPGDVPKAAAFDGSGNLIVGSANKLTKLGTAGTTTWTLDMAVHAVATGPADTIYVDTGTALVKLDASGTQLWSVTHGLGACSLDDGARGDLAVASDGAVAKRGTGVGRWDASGTPSWTKTLQSDGDRCSVAIDASGNVAASDESANNGEDTDIVRWSSTGTALSTLSDVSSQYHGLITANAGGLIACTSGHSHAYLVGPGIDVTATVSVAAYTPNWCAAAGTSDVGWLYWSGENNILVQNWKILRYVSAGTSPWSLQRNALTASFDEYGTIPWIVAGSPTGRLAAVGGYRSLGSTTATAWVQVYDP